MRGIDAGNGRFTSSLSQRGIQILQRDFVWRIYRSQRTHKFHRQKRYTVKSEYSAQYATAMSERYIKE